jgi:hypothetical protein
VVCACAEPDAQKVSTESKSGNKLVVEKGEKAEALAALEKAGIFLERDDKDRVVKVDMTDTAATDADVEKLKWTPHVNELKLFGTKITDKALVHLAPLKELKLLHIGKTAVTDAGLTHLRGLKNLETIGLSETKVSDRGLRYLEYLPKLKTLYLFGSKVTDRGLKRMRRRFPDIYIVEP